MENIYSYNWYGARTGWEYRVVIKKSATTELSATNEIVLPRGSFKMKSTKWEYDSYPIGLHSAKVLEAEINLSMLESSDYDDFVAMLYNPIIEVNKTIYVNTVRYYYGTTIEYYIKFNGNAETEVNTFKLQFIGMLREDQENEGSNDLDRIYKINAEDINRANLDQSSFIDIHALSHIDDTNRVGYIDYYINSSPNKAILHLCNYNNSILFQKFETLENYINGLSQTLYRDMIRDQSAIYTIDIPINRYYKQTYDGSGIKGTELTKSDIYLLTTLFYDVSPIGGLYDPDDEDSLNQKYQSLWDFLSDYYQSTLQRAYSTPTGIKSSSIFGYTDSETIVTLDVNQIELSYKQMSKLLKKVTSSLVEARGNDYEDKDSFPNEIIGSRNAKEFTIPVLLNTMPSQDGWLQWDWLVRRGLPEAFTPKAWLNSIGISESSKVFGGFELRRFGLYYKENTAFTANAELIRVHEDADYLIYPGKYASDINAYDELDLSTDPFDSAAAIVAMLQDKSSPQISSYSLLQIFSHKEQHTAKIKVKLEYLTDFKAGGSVGFIWDNPNCKMLIDLGALDSRKTMSFNEWYILSSSIDYEAEIAEIELILKVI